MPPESHRETDLPGHELKIPAVLMRGGTSRGLIFRREDLPGTFEDSRPLWDLIFLCALGSPDPRQLDGLGAGDSHCSKVAVLSPAADADRDLDFLFAEVAIDEARVDYAGNSGNIISAVGLYAVEEGWVAATAPRTRVRIRNLNTGKTIEVWVPSVHGRAAASGHFHIDGLPAPGPEIQMRFPDPGASLCPALLPTGRPLDTLKVPGNGDFDATLVDAANPIVLLDGAGLGVDPRTPIAELNRDTALRKRLQTLRAAAAVACGLVESPGDAWAYSPMVPFPVLVFAPCGYPHLLAGSPHIEASSMDLSVRVISLGRFHKTINVTVSIAVSAAAQIPGSLIQRLCPAWTAGPELRIGHPCGSVPTHTETSTGDDGRTVIEAVSLSRSARRIMQGEIIAPAGKLQWLASLRK